MALPGERHLMYSKPLWIFHCEDYVVYEIEHLFGFDCVLARRCAGDLAAPVRMHTYVNQMSVDQRKIAHKWAMAVDRIDYALAAALCRQLAEQLAR